MGAATTAGAATSTGWSRWRSRRRRRSTASSRPDPVLIEADARSTLDHALGRELADAARAEGLEPRHVVLERYGSDASNAYADGGIGRAACIAMATDNTHGCEIAHLDAVANVTRTLARWLEA